MGKCTKGKEKKNDQLHLSIGLEGDVEVDLAVVRKVKMSGKLNPFIDLIAFKSSGDVKLAFTNLFRIQSILVKDLEVDLVLAGTLFNGEGEGLVPHWVIGVLENLGALLVFLVKPELTKRRVLVYVYANMFQVSSVFLHKGIVLRKREEG